MAREFNEKLNTMKTRQDIIKQAYHECMTEMYAKAQPSVDYDKLLEDFRSGVIKDERNCPIYSRYYLSHQEFNYILNKYIDAYGMKNTWHPWLDTVRRYFDGKGMKDVWIQDRVDEYGFKHPGYRSAEEVPHIADAFKKILSNEIEGDVTVNKLVETLSKTVFEYIDNCENFYRFDREEGDFSCNIALGASPTSNANSVVEYWKNQGVDVNIEWRNPLLLWEMDRYGDDFEEYMFEEYGKDWKEYWDNEWEKRKDLKNYGYDE